MPTTNFSFPGVSLEQVFVPRPVGTQAALGTICIGPKYKIHSHGYTENYSPITTWEPGTDAQYPLPDYSASDGILDTTKEFDKLHVVNGLWQYGTGSGSLDISNGTYTIEMPITSVNGRYPAAGDMVKLTDGSNASVYSTILGVTTGQDGKVVVDIVPTSAEDGDSLTVVFCLVADVDYAGEAELADVVVYAATGKVKIPGTLTSDFTDGFTTKTQGTLIKCNTMYYDYRALDDTKSAYGIVSNATDIQEQLGPAINANPLAQVTACALAAAGGNYVYWINTGVPNSAPDAADKYLRCLDYMGDNAAVYNVAPATTDRNVILQLAGEVERIGKDENSKVRRTLWAAIDTPKEIFVFSDVAADISADDTEIVETTLLAATAATITATGTEGQYTVTYGSGTLDEVDVAVSDIVRIGTTDYTISAVSGDVVTITLSAGQTISEGEASAALIHQEIETVSWSVEYPASGDNSNPLVGNPIQKGDALRIGSVDYQIINDNGVNTVTISKEAEQAAPTTGTGIITSIVRKSPTDMQVIDSIIAECPVKSYRVQCVWSDTPFYNGEYVSNYCVAAAAAGMRTAEEPWRPLSNLSYSFFSLEQKNNFTKSQLERLGANGIWIVANNDDDIPINKKSITSIANNDINTTSESIVANADEIAITLSRVGEELVGSSNISDMLLIVLKDGITNLLDARCTNATSAYVGNQLISYEIIDIYQDPVNQDEVKADIELVPPKPFNRFRITMRIV